MDTTEVGAASAMEHDVPPHAHAPVFEPVFEHGPEPEPVHGPEPERVNGPEPVPPMSARVHAIRIGVLEAVIAAAIFAAYALATPGGPHRGAILAVTVTMLTVFGLTWWYAGAVARCRAQAVVRVAGVLFYIVGSALLSLLDGGVAGPLGAILPFSLIFLALSTPPKVFAGLAAVTWVAYWCVALLGGPAPPGYAVAYTLGFGGTSYICLRHAGALVSLRRRLAEVSRTDSLTGALNRRGLGERLQAEFAEACRTGGALTLVFADLDRFKEINDTYGHQAGDQLLAWTAGRLAQDLRAHDAVGRVGGDEFALVLGDTGPEEAAATVRRLRAVLEPAAPASFGHASYPADAGTLAELARVADARVYQDKQGGVRRLPTVPAVAAAREAVARPAAQVWVSSQERRRRSVADMGRVAMCGFVIGVFYAAVFAGGRPHQLAIGVLGIVGSVLGGTVALLADRLSRVSWTRWLMNACAVVMAPLAVAMTTFDGGVYSVCGLGILLTMPLIALSNPVRLAAPVLGLFLSLYVVVAVVVGGPVWYAVMHLFGTVAVSVGCAEQGRAAARQRRLLTRLSRVDALTGVLNRRGFEERFAAELAHARRTGGAISLLIFDLDGFKAVNDLHGHAAGDELLCWVAGTLAANVHAHDAVGRLGGDEFIVLLTSPATEQAAEPAVAAVAVAERLRAVLAARTGCSFGVATLGRDGTDLESLYSHADSGLYTQKSCRRPSRPAGERDAVTPLAATADEPI